LLCGNCTYCFLVDGIEYANTLGCGHQCFGRN
jgi:hypothetical protein